MQPGIKALRKINATHFRLRQPPLKIGFVVLAFVTLACGFAGTASQSASDRPAGLTPLPTLTRTRLPTFTPTTSSDLNSIARAAEPAGATSTLVPAPINTVAVPVVTEAGPTSLKVPTSTPTSISTLDKASDPTDISATALPPTPTDASTATPADTATIPPTETPRPTDTPRPEPTSTPSPTATIPPVADYDDWSFANVQMEADGDTLAIYGEVINHTGITQELDVMGGVFYDDHGEVIADDRDMETNWAFTIVPPGERVSFEVVVDGIQEAADFELYVEAQPAGDS